MESINGIDFFEILIMLNDRTFNPIAVAFYASNIILILEYIHNLNIIYRDLKVENIMIDDEVNNKNNIFQGYPRLIDFGASKILKNKS